MLAHHKFTVEKLASCSLIACDFKQSTIATFSASNSLINDMQCQSFMVLSKLLSNRPAFKTKGKNGSQKKLVFFLQNIQYVHL